MVTANLINGTYSYNIATTITANLVNGTYSYNIATTDKIYHANGGSFTESAGSPSSEAITFNLYKSSVTFAESVLPSSTQWFVNITNESSSKECSFDSFSTSFSIYLINGTYSYNIATTEIPM